MAAGVLVVDNYDSFTRNLTALIAEAGHGFTVVRNDRIPADALLRYGKVLISPGPGTPSDAGGLGAFIRECAPSASILGVCLGHQAIAEAFGGRLVRLARPDHGVRKTVTVTDPACRLFRGVPDSFGAGLYHSWAVAGDSLPPEIRVTALSEEGEIMALSHARYDVHGIQFHPESVMTPEGRTILSNWLDA
jgi:anthranilate synthase component 2